jgi:hypothetical protein
LILRICKKVEKKRKNWEVRKARRRCREGRGKEGARIVGPEKEKTHGKEKIFRGENKNKK